jgi:hypothetical protein
MGVSTSGSSSQRLSTAKLVKLGSILILIWLGARKAERQKQSQNGSQLSLG